MAPTACRCPDGRRSRRSPPASRRTSSSSSKRPPRKRTCRSGTTASYGARGAGAGQIDEQLKRRLRVLFDADISLAAYHLPLDAHLELGNNALLAQALGAEELRPFAVHRGEPIG